MKSVTTSRFRKLRDQLPSEIKRKGDQTYMLWKENPYHPSLQFKRIHVALEVYSVRISLGYRALGRLENEVLIWFWIGSHSDYDQLISSLK